MESRSSVYKDMCLQQLYTQAFQVCLFKGVGHNPMLQMKNQSIKQRSFILQKDHESLVEILGSLIVNQECLNIILNENEGQFQNFLSKQKEFNACDRRILQNSETVESKKKLHKQKLVDLAQNNLNKIYNSFEFDPIQKPFLIQTSTSNKHSDANDCVLKSIPIVFSLSCSLIWQMKMFPGFDQSKGINTLKQKMMLGQQILQGMNSVGAMIGVGGLAPVAALGGIITAREGIDSIAMALSLCATGSEFTRFFKDSKEMERSYECQLKDLLTKFGYKPEDQQSIAGLEQELTEICQWLLQQDEIGYHYKDKEKKLNQKILECILQTNASEEQQERDTKEEIELKRMVKQKINFLSKEDIFQNLENDVRLAPSRGLSALLVFVWNNYRIRSCLSKTMTIGIMGDKNAGKSTLAKMLGCPIERTGENHCTLYPTLYQNVPINNCCVIDFPPLDYSNKNAKMFYSLVDIAIIVMKSQDRVRTRRHEINLEVSEIIKIIQIKYSQWGYENMNREFPVLLLFNQVDKMIFDEDGHDLDDKTLYYNFLQQKSDIVRTLREEYGIDENKLFHLFASLNPKLPKPSERIQQYKLDLQNQFTNQNISMEEYTKELMRCANLVDRDRLQDVTGCSFFSFEIDPQEKPRSVVRILAKIVQDLGDKQGADSIIDIFKYSNRQILDN